MADWYGSSRSNYFRVKDEAKFLEWAKTRDLEVWDRTDDKGKLFAIAPSDMGDGGWPSWDPDAKNEEDAEICIGDELSAFLADGSCAVLLTIGAEKLRYLDGWATAYSCAGEVAHINLNDIYQEVSMADSSLEVTEAMY